MSWDLPVTRPLANRVRCVADGLTGEALWCPGCPYCVAASFAADATGHAALDWALGAGDQADPQLTEVDHGHRASMEPTQVVAAPVAEAPRVEQPAQQQQFVI